jgi:hypothetical protein
MAQISGFRLGTEFRFSPNPYRIYSESILRKSGPSRPLSLVINLVNLKDRPVFLRPKPSFSLRLFNEILSIKGKNIAIPR